MVSNKEDSKPKFRICLNAAEIGLRAEIIDKSKLVRNQIGSKLISTVTRIIATLPTYKSNICEIIEGTLEDKSTSKRLLTNMTMGMVSSGSFFRGGCQAATRADVIDGLLDVVLTQIGYTFNYLHGLHHVA